MKKYKILLCMLVCCTFISCQLIAQNKAEYKPGHLIIQFTKEAYQRLNLKENANTGLSELDKLQRKYKASSIQPLFTVTPKNKTLDEKYGLSRTFLIKLPAQTDIKTVARDYKALMEIAIAEPNYILKLSGSSHEQKKMILSALSSNTENIISNQPAAFPNDPLYSLQWSHYNAGNTVIPYGGVGTVGTADCDADTYEAWSITTGSTSVIIAFIDSGIDWAHPDFSGRIIPGWNFENNNSNTQDTHGHGTITAGIAAATGNNNIGVAGVDWQCKIMPLVVFPNLSNATSVDKVIDAIIFAANNGADIINMSFGRSSFDESQPGIFENTVNYAYNSGCALFAASGNDNHTSPEYPAAFANVMAIGGLSPCNERKKRIINGGGSCDKDIRQDSDESWGSNYGNWLDIVAPAVLLPTTDIVGMNNGYSAYNNCQQYSPPFCLQSTPDGNYLKDMFGTSIASPFAAGVASLMLSVNPNLTPSQIYQILKTTANDIEAPGIDIETGYGRINAYKAVQQALVYNCAPTRTVTQDIEESILTYKAVNTVTATNTIYANASGIYKAEGNIYLKPGFEVKQNGYHKSYIADCETDNFNKAKNNLYTDILDDQNLLRQHIDESKKSIAAYPNPFTNTVKFEYSLPENSKVSCSIYDQYGKKITDILTTTYQNKGRHTIKWNAEKFTAGIYLFELIVEGKKETLRVIKTN